MRLGISLQELDASRAEREERARPAAVSRELLAAYAVQGEALQQFYY